MSQDEIEYEIVDTQAPVRQGDILFFPSVGEAAPWDQRGIVLTADCDLAWGASRGLVTIIPIVSMDTYVRHNWAERKVRRLRAQALTTCRSMIAKKQAGDEAELAISEEAVARWIETTPAGEICDARKIIVERDRDSFLLQSKIFLLCNGDLGVPPKECLSILLEGRCMTSNSTKEAEAAKALKQAGSELQEVPQDTFYISTLPGVEGKGFYALLRDLRHFSLSQISTSLTEAREAVGKAFRAARLKPVYKYSLIQQFALLFSRIGLPQGYQDAYKVTVTALGQPPEQGAK